MENVKYTTEKSRPNLFRKISGGLKTTITLLLVLFVSISTFGQIPDISGQTTTETRFYNNKYGKYTKEMALQKVNDYIARLKKEGFIFNKIEEKSAYHFTVNWREQYDAPDSKLVVIIEYIIGDNHLTLKLKTAVYFKSKDKFMILDRNHKVKEIGQLYNNQVGLFIDGLFDYISIKNNIPNTQTTTTAGANTDNTNADKTTKTKAQTPYRPFEYIDISNKTLSPEVKTFIKAYNSNPEKLGDHITNMGKTLQNKNYTGGKQYERFLALMTEVYNVDKYLAFRSFMRVDKKTLDEAMKLMPKEMREYMRQEAKYVLQKQKEMETEQNTTTKSSNTNTSNPYSGMSTEAAAYFASYKINPNGLKKYLGNQHKSWEDKGYSAEKITQSYADMFKEVYTKDKKAAFELIIHMPASWLEADKLKSVFSLLTREQQLYIQDEANRR